MGCTVSELLDKIDIEELDDWKAFFELEPFGSWTENLNAGMIASLIYNSNRGKHSVTMDMYDMALGDYKKPVKKQSISEMNAMLRQLAEVQNKPKNRVKQKITIDRVRRRRD